MEATISHLPSLLLLFQLADPVIFLPDDGLSSCQINLLLLQQARLGLRCRPGSLSILLGLANPQPAGQLCTHLEFWPCLAVM